MNDGEKGASVLMIFVLIVISVNIKVFQGDMIYNKYD
jgi:hypothetical protein